MTYNSILLLALSSFAFVKSYSNVPPIPERHPGYPTGSKASGIEIEVAYDLLCSDSAYANPIF